MYKYNLNSCSIVETMGISRPKPRNDAAERLSLSDGCTYPCEL